MRWLVVIVVALGGCDSVLGLELRTLVPCTTDDECVDGVNEGTCSCGQCSYRDAECPVTALRWPANAGRVLGNACVPAINQIDSRVFHTCATMTDGTAWCWGTNTDGQLGAGTMATSASAPLQVRSTADIAGDLREVRAGGASTCAIRTDGTVVCWGSNDFGQLGAGLTPGTDSVDPVVVVTENGGPLTNVIELSLGYFHACAVTDSEPDIRQLFCWGANSKGQVGDGTSGTDRIFAVRVTIPGVLQQLAAGGAHTCAITNGPEGNLTYCWGDPGTGRLGNNMSMGAPITAPTRVLVDAATPYRGANAIAAGNTFTCTIKNPPFDFFCWGANNAGQLGIGTMDPRNVATRVSGASDVPRHMIAAGDHHTCGQISNDIACWGSDSHGQLGNAAASTMNVVEPAVVIQGNPHHSLTAGHEHTCALDSARKLRCWGANSFGQLGTGDLVEQAAPIEIAQSSFCPGP